MCDLQVPTDIIEAVLPVIWSLAICEFQYFYSFLAVILFAAN